MPLLTTSQDSNTGLRGIVLPVLQGFILRSLSLKSAGCYFGGFSSRSPALGSGGLNINVGVEWVLSFLVGRLWEPQLKSTLPQQGGGGLGWDTSSFRLSLAGL